MELVNCLDLRNHKTIIYIYLSAAVPKSGIINLSFSVFSMSCFLEIPMSRNKTKLTRKMKHGSKSGTPASRDALIGRPWVIFRQ